MKKKTKPSRPWLKKLSEKNPESNKYDYGHVVILGGGRLTGAATLAGISALRMGAGLVTIVAQGGLSGGSGNVYRAQCPSLMVEDLDQLARFKDHIADPRRNVVVLGPGAGLENPAALKKSVFDSLQSDQPKIVILDADALSVFADDPKLLIRATHARTILTPHDGEFAKIFPDCLLESKIDSALAAAAKAKCYIVLKGPLTVIAAPDGQYVTDENGPSSLATAGTGDVLAGMIAGLVAGLKMYEDLSLLEALAAAVYMHGEAARAFGPGLISSDLPNQIPKVWEEILG